MTLEMIRTVATLRARVADWRKAGLRVGLVPTMGALHDGHISLVRLCRSHADRVIVTLFVNPTQFNSQDDLAAYPRTEAEDAVKLDKIGVDVLYAPATGEMYPDRFATTVRVAGVSEGLCGAFRPGHFDGVATVVSKLLLQAGPDCAVFGEKDYQQLAVIRRLVSDLNIPTSVVAGPTIRESDGLAMSSRNGRLTPGGRTRAPAMFKALCQAAEALKTGADPDQTLSVARQAMIDAGFSDIEYIELRDAGSLAPLDSAVYPARLLAAAWIDGVRLIDNVPVEPGVG